MSRATTDAPTTSPLLSWIGDMVSETSTGLSPLRMCTVSRFSTRSPKRTASRYSRNSSGRSSGHRINVGLLRISDSE